MGGGRAFYPKKNVDSSIIIQKNFQLRIIIDLKRFPMIVKAELPHIPLCPSIIY